MLSIEGRLIVFCLLEIVNLLLMSFEVQSEFWHWPYNGSYIGLCRNLQNLRVNCVKEERKSRKMFTVPAAMFETGGKPRFHALDPGSVGPVLLCHLFCFTSLFVFFVVVSLFISFLLFVCFLFCIGVDFFSCFYLALSVTLHNATLGVTLRERNSPELVYSGLLVKTFKNNSNIQ